MNLHFAHVVEVTPGEGMLAGKVRVGGAIKTVSFDLLPDARKGDEVLLCDGVVINRVETHNEKGKYHVPGNSR